MKNVVILFAFGFTLLLFGVFSISNPEEGIVVAQLAGSRQVDVIVPAGFMIVAGIATLITSTLSAIALKIFQGEQEKP